MGPNPQEITDLVTFTEEIVNGKLHFLCSIDCLAEVLMGRIRQWIYLGTLF